MAHLIVNHLFKANNIILAPLAYHTPLAYHRTPLTYAASAPIQYVSSTFIY